MFFIYAVMGMTLFGNMEVGRYEFIDEYTNFQNFGDSMLTLLRISTGESWNGISRELQSFSGVGAALYMVSFVIIVQFSVLNLFVAVILSNFEAELARNTIDQRSLSQFRTAWGQLTRACEREVLAKLQLEHLVHQKERGVNLADVTAEERRRSEKSLRRIVKKLVYPLYLPASYFPSLFRRLKPPLGVQDAKHFTNAEMLRIIRIARIPVTRTGFIQYHSTLRALISLKFRINQRSDDSEMPRELQELALDLNISADRRGFMKLLYTELAEEVMLDEVLAARKIREAIFRSARRSREHSSVSKMRGIVSSLWGEVDKLGVLAGPVERRRNLRYWISSVMDERTVRLAQGVEEEGQEEDYSGHGRGGMGVATDDDEEEEKADVPPPPGFLVARAHSHRSTSIRRMQTPPVLGPGVVKEFGSADVDSKYTLEQGLRSSVDELVSSGNGVHHAAAAGQGSEFPNSEESASASGLGGGGGRTLLPGLKEGEDEEEKAIV